MPFGCFGKRRRRDKADELGEKDAADVAKDGHGKAEPPDGNNIVSDVTKLPLESNGGGDEVSEVVTVARAHSLHASAPNTVEHRRTAIGIQKSATLARYDFLRKSEFGSTADRWSALKQQYLLTSPSMSNSASQQSHRVSAPAQNGSAGGVKRTALSLPRQFAPPDAPATPVRFSQWFYERQAKEADARREFHEREEKNRKLLEGIEDAASVPDDSAAVENCSKSANSVEPPADCNDVLITAAATEEKPAAAADEGPIGIPSADPQIVESHDQLNAGAGDTTATEEKQDSVNDAEETLKESEAVSQDPPGCTETAQAEQGEITATKIQHAENV